jgi:uncharacterized membrane protein YgdD (TMEM256/DUF423 family)
MNFSRVGALSGFLAVLVGAFGAHALRARLSPELLQTFETGTRYQMFHALALLHVGMVAEREPRPGLRAAGWLFVIGTVLFSGSLYALALSGTRFFGAITPLGGLCFLIGWLALARATFSRPDRPASGGGRQ